MIAALLLHLGEGARIAYGVSPLVIGFAAFWFVVACVAIWRQRGAERNVGARSSVQPPTSSRR